MKLQQARGAVFVERREVPWDAMIVAKLGELSPYSLFSKLAGLNDNPQVLIRCKVSALSKVYATLLSALSLAGTLQAFMHAADPSLVSEEFALVTLTGMRDMSTYIRPIYSAALTSIRILLAFGLHKKSYLTSIRRITREILGNPYLRHLYVDMRKIRRILGVVNLSYSLWLVVAGFAFITVKPSLARKPMFYVLLFESYLYVSAIGVAACYMLVVSWFVVLPLLGTVTNIFEDAVEARDIYMLRSAVACHDTCRRLIETIDGIGSYFFGISVLSGVPLIAIAASSLSRIGEEQGGYGFRATMLFAFIYFSFMVSFIVVASVVYREVHKPQMILTDHVIVDGEFLKLSSQFLARFQVRSFGYTFFHLVTIRRETILSVFSLITTYVIIAFQLKEC